MSLFSMSSNFKDFKKLRLEPLQRVGYNLYEALPLTNPPV